MDLTWNSNFTERTFLKVGRLLGDRLEVMFDVRVVSVESSSSGSLETASEIGVIVKEKRRKTKGQPLSLRRKVW